MLKKKQIKLKDAIISLSIVAIISMPIIIFVLINSFDLPAIELPFLTIPRMVQNRYETVTTLFSGNIIINSLKNFFNSIEMLVFQSDGLPWNSMEGFGIIYIFSLPLTIVGIIKELKRKNEVSNIINLWFLIAFLMLFICEANINRCNIIMIPIVYYTVIGIYEAVEKFDIFKYAISIIYLIYFIMFEYEYFNLDWSQYYTFVNGVQEIVDYVENIEDVENIYFPYDIKEPYIYVLFYSKTSPYVFKDTVQKKNPNGTFENVEAFGKYKFYNEVTYEEDRKNLYIIRNQDDLNIDEEMWETNEVGNYIVIRSKN